VALSQAIAQHTSPEDLTMANLPYISPAIEFYTFRNIQWEMSLADALDRAEENAAPAMYIYCPVTALDECPEEATSAVDTGSARLPAVLAGFSYEVGGGCWFVRLR
jgi:hypothetical protein